MSVYIVSAFSAVGLVKHLPTCELQKQGAETNQKVLNSSVHVEDGIFFKVKTFKQPSALMFELKFQHDLLKLICLK